MTDIRVFDSIEDIGLFRTQWNELLERSAANYIYSTPEWVESWHETFGSGSELRIVAAFKNNSLAGLLPTALRKAPLAEMGGKRLEFVSGRQGDFHDLIVERGLEHDVVPALLDNMLNDNLVVFHHVMQGSPTLPFVYSSFHRKSYKVNTHEETAPYLRLSPSKEEVEKRWSKSHRTDLRRQRKRLQGLGNLEFRVCSRKEEALQLLPAFFETYRVSWQSRGRRIKPEHERLTQRFLRELITRIGFSDDGKRIHFSSLNLNGAPISYHFGFLYNNHLYYYKPTYDRKYENYSPGKVHLLHLIEHCMDSGWKVFDFLIGDEPYKYSWTKDDRKVITLVASKDSPLSSFRKWWLVAGKEHARNLMKPLKRGKSR